MSLVRFRSKLVTRLAVAGMFGAVAGLGGLALWAAVVTERGAAQLTSAGVQTTGHLRAVQVLAMVDNHTDELEDEYDPALRAAVERDLRALDEALERMRGGGVSVTSGLGDRAAAAMTRLRPAVGRFLEAKAAGRDDDAEAAEDAMEDVLEEMEAVVHRLDPDPSLVLTGKLEAVTGSLRAVRTTAFVLVPLGLLFVAAGGWLLRAYRRRSDEVLREAMETSAAEARTDQLTGLANRRALVEALDAVAAEGAPAVLALADLNGFKAYNDTFGHPAGDALLRRLGRRLAAAFGPGAIAARLGGDEFCVLVRGDADDADVRRRVREALAEEGEGFGVTASCGTVVAPRDAEAADALLRAADERMYAAKRLSRPGVDEFVAEALLRMLDERHPGLGRHVEAVADLAGACAEALGLPEEAAATVRRAAELHDVGKVAIPTAILTKPGALNPDELEFVRRHTVIGERILLGVPSLRPVADLVRASHERWDGAGYPDGLAARDIPLGARIVAVTDAFCAMTEDRPYAEARSLEDAVRELRACAGSQFDPAVVDVFVRALRERVRPDVAVA